MGGKGELIKTKQFLKTCKQEHTNTHTSAAEVPGGTNVSAVEGSAGAGIIRAPRARRAGAVDTKLAGWALRGAGTDICGLSDRVRVVSDGYRER